MVLAYHGQVRLWKRRLRLHGQENRREILTTAPRARRNRAGKERRRGAPLRMTARTSCPPEGGRYIGVGGVKNGGPAESSGTQKQSGVPTAFRASICRRPNPAGLG